MGVLSGKDIFSAKYITAKITDASNHMYFVAIKNVLGDYFLAEIEDQIYCFEIDGSRVKTYRHKAVKSWRMIDYDTNHYKPVAPAQFRELELILQKNNLPKINMLMFGMMKLLGKREKKEFSPHDVKTLIEELSHHEGEYKEQVTNITNYLKQLNIDQIVTPVKKVSEFIEDDLIVTDPQFLGSIISSYQRTDAEHKKVTNTPITGKAAWMKIIAILAIIVLVVVVGYYVYSSGMLNNLVPQIGGQQTPAGIMEKYPTPEALKAAIDRGEVNYQTLPPDVKKLVDNVKLPTVQAKP